jgi:membrane-bound metal-dependent hydrolase YbcI (DUF457 family)
MPGWKAHAIVGVLAAGALSASQGRTLNELAAGVAIVGALAPDLDHPKAKLNSVLGTGFLGRVFRHRGFLHSFAAAGLFAAGVYALAGAASIGAPLQVAAVGGAAYASHLLIDGSWKLA